MEPKKQSIYDLFANNNLYVIPCYQRKYEWDKSNCKQLLDDLLNAGAKNQPHLMGTIVLDQSKTQPNTYFIIDGQQRLLTFYLLIKALSVTATTKICMDDLDELRKMLYFNNDSNILKVKPIASDEKVLEDIVKKNLINDKSNLVTNYNYFCNKIKERLQLYRGSQFIDGLKNLEGAVVFFNEDSNEDPQIVFEKINASGIKLALHDQIKNFMLICPDEKMMNEIYTNYWVKLEDQFKDLENYSHLFDDFLINYFLYKIDGNIRQEGAYFSFTNYVSNNSKNHPDFKMQILSEMIILAKYYLYFAFGCYDHNFNTDIHYPRIINAYLTWFKILGQTTIYPFLFHLFKKSHEHDISDDILAKILNFIFIYYVRRKLSNIASEPLTQLFKNLFKNVYFDSQGNSMITNSIDYYTFLVAYLTTNDAVDEENKYQSDANVIDNLLKNKVNDPLAIKCLFLCLNYHNLIPECKELAYEDNKFKGWKEMQIEYIIPDNERNSVWKSYLKDQAFDFDWMFENGKLGLIGNLGIISSKNKNHTADDTFNKKQSFFQGCLYKNIYQFVINYQGKWNLDAINERSLLISSQAVQLFKINDDVNDISLRKE